HHGARQRGGGAERHRAGAGTAAEGTRLDFLLKPLHSPAHSGASRKPESARLLYLQRLYLWHWVPACARTNGEADVIQRDIVRLWINHSSPSSSSPSSFSPLILSAIRPEFWRTAASMREATSGFCLRKVFAFSRPWPMRWLS